MHLKQSLLFAFLTLFVVTSQVAAFQSFAEEKPSYLEPERFRQESEMGSQAHELQKRVQSMAKELFNNLEEPDPQVGDLADGLLVCTFVDINKLYKTSSFGRYLAGQLMNEFQRFAYPVIDMRKSLNVMVQEKRGEYGLSRDPDEIATSQTAGAMLTGTYLVGEGEIIVNARILDNKSATLLSSATVIFPRNSLGNHMLKDSATARKRPADVVYMKRLEM